MLGESGGGFSGNGPAATGGMSALTGVPVFGIPGVVSNSSSSGWGPGGRFGSSQYHLREEF